MSIENAMDDLHFQISSLHKDLVDDDIAMNWFDLSLDVFSIPSASQSSDIPSTPLAAMPNLIKDKFQGLCCIKTLIAI